MLDNQARKCLTQMIHIEEKKCRICHSENIHLIIDFGCQPPANSLRDDLSKDLPAVPLELVRCTDCKTVQLNATIDPKFLFSEYVWVTGTSIAANEYSQIYCNEVLKRSLAKRPFVVEIASNDGTFLKRFKQEGCKVLGVDPAKNIAALANANDIETLAEFFDEELAKQVLEKNGEADIVMARNVLPHVKEIHSIIKGINHLVSPEGIVAIEFHYSKKILSELHYDSVYHEHLFYFSLQTISELFAGYGLYSFDAFDSPISGGSLVVFFSKDEKTKSEKLKAVMELEEFEGLNSEDSWDIFAHNVVRHAKDLRALVDQHLGGKGLIAYGASARSSTLLNYLKLTSAEIDYIIDKNPLKQNKFSPGANIPIVSYEVGMSKSQGKSLLLLAWNFHDEIVKELRQTGFKGDIIIPLPNQAYVL